MNTSNFLIVLGRNWKNIAIITFLVIVITAIFTFVQPLKYRSTSKLLVVQEYSTEVDPYAGSRSTQYLSNVLVKVVQSSSFFDEVMKAGFNIEDNFGSDQEKRQKNWIKTVSANAISDSGIIVVNTYHRNPEQADQISRAVNFVLKSKNSMYHGWGDKVSVRTIEKPLASKYPVNPNVPLNLSFAVIFGLILGSSFVYLFPNYKIFYKRKKHLTAKKKDAPNGIPIVENEIKNQYSASSEKRVFSKEQESLPSRDLQIEKMILNNYSKPPEKKVEDRIVKNEAEAQSYSVGNLMDQETVAEKEIDQQPMFGEDEEKEDDLKKYREILPREDEDIDFGKGDMGQFVGK